MDNLSHSLYIPTLAFLNNNYHAHVDVDLHTGKPLKFGISDSVLVLSFDLLDSMHMGEIHG